MVVKALPIKGTRMHVWNRRKYYPGEVYEVDDELGAVLIQRRIAVEVVQKKKAAPPPPAPAEPAFKRGPGRPRKYPRD